MPNEVKELCLPIFHLHLTRCSDNIITIAMETINTNFNGLPVELQREVFTWVSPVSLF